LLIFGSGLAPLHAHESDSPHSHAIVHRHFEPHHDAIHQGHGESELDHDEHIVWLDMAVVPGLPYQLHTPAAVLAPLPDPVACSRRWSAIVFDEAAPPHGPPRASASLRGPPARPS
jgi:hypothetical protein